MIMDSKEESDFKPNMKQLENEKASHIHICKENEYISNPIIKVHNWQDKPNSLPYDNCPYRDGKNNLHLSHYKRLGTEACHCYATTTNDMLNQLQLRENYTNKHPAKHITSYFSFKDTNRCKESDIKKLHACIDDYISTMDKSYVPPYPYVMTPISIPKTPFMETRLMKREDANTSNNTYYDEDTISVIKKMQCYKSHRSNSYNFFTGVYQDETLPPERRRDCVVPEYARKGGN